MSLPNQRKSKFLALKTISEKVEDHDSSGEDVVDKDVAYLVKNFRKFLKFKKMANLAIKENSKVQEGRKRNLKGKKEKNPNLHKVSLVSNVTGMDTLRRNVRII